MNLGPLSHSSSPKPVIALQPCLQGLPWERSSSSLKKQVQAPFHKAGQHIAWLLLAYPINNYCIYSSAHTGAWLLPSFVASLTSELMRKGTLGSSFLDGIHRPASFC